MKSNCPIQSQITLANDTIASLKERIRKIELRLNDDELEPTKRKIIENELVEISKLLTTSEEELSKLHTENSRSFVIAAILFFIGFVVYGLYLLVNGI